jgi:hypothetical protein
MPSYFSVVRYVPDPVTDERLNIGVIAFGEGKILSRFIEGWGKVKIFGGEDIGFLREFADEIERKQLNLFSAGGCWDERTLEGIAAHWKNSIQLSEPKASLQSPEELLAEIASRYVREPVRRQRERKDKREAVRLGLQAVTESFFRRHGQALPSELIKRHHPIEGARDRHSLDLVVGNGHLFFAAEALSFQGQYSDEIRKEVDAALWVIEDIRKANKNLPLAVLALPPSGKMPLFSKARKIFKKEFKADFITDNEVVSWGNKMAKAIKPRARIVHKVFVAGTLGSEGRVAHFPKALIGERKKHS